MRNTIIALIVGLFIGSSTTYFISKQFITSKANGYLYAMQANVANDLVRVLNHVEKKVAIKGVAGADCDVFAEYHSLIGSYASEVESGVFTIHGDDKEFAIDAINESLAKLESYRDRHGKKNCSNVQLPI